MAFLVVLPVAMLCSVAFDKRIEETIGLSMIWAALLTYICGIVYRLDIAPAIMVVAAVVCGVTAIVLSVKQKKTPEFLTLGFLEYLLLSAYYMLVMRNRYIDGQDGLRVYERYVSDFYHVGDISRYRNPVGLMMWKYLSLKFWPNYSEGIQLIGPVMMCVAFMLFVFSFKERDFKHTLVKSLIGFFVIVFLPLNFRGNGGYFVMQYDFVSGMLTAYILCALKKLWDTKDSYYKMLILSSLVYLVHIKTTGIILAGICVLIMVGMDMVQGQGEGFKRYSFSIIAGISVILSKLTWSLFCRLHDADEKFSLGTALGKMNIVLLVAVVIVAIAAFIAVLIVVLKRKYNLYLAALICLALAVFAGTLLILPSSARLDTIMNFGRMLFSNYAVDREYGLGSKFLMPYIIAIVSLPVFLFIASKASGKEIIRLENKTFVTLTNVGFLLYLSVVFLTNFYGRTINQTIKAKECERYIFVYIIVFILVYFYLLMQDYDTSEYYKPVMLILLVVGFFMTKTAYLYTQVVNRSQVDTFDGLNYVNITAEDKFYYVDQRSEQSKDQFYFRTSPAKMVKWDYTDLYLSEDGMDEKVTYNEWVDQLKSCTYVYLATTNENFASEYGDIFEDDIIDGRIYTVRTEGDGVKLRSIDY